MAGGSQGYTWGPQTARRQLSRHLSGSGAELGPGHVGFPILTPGAPVHYLDCWRPSENRDRFPELREADYVEPDTVCDFNVEGLSPLADASQDFVIASHVLEHMANPLRMLCEIHRVLRPGGTLLLFLPDRHVTFDKDRPPTPLAHLVDEYERQVTEVDDAHIEEFLVFTANHQGEGPPESRTTPDPDMDLEGLSVYERGLALLWLNWDDVTNPAHRRELVELHRQRSIHAHVWDVDEFVEVLLYCIRSLGHQWEFVDGALPGEPGAEQDEFGLVLRRATTGNGHGELADRMQAGWTGWRSYRGAVLAEFRGLGDAVEAAGQELERLRARVAQLERELEELRTAPPTVGGSLRSLARATGTDRYIGPLYRAVKPLRGAGGP